MVCAQDHWENRATVRHKSRIMFDKTQSGYIYPRSIQALSIHLKIACLDKDSLHYLLTQSFYHYNHNIASIETIIINQIVLMAVTDKIKGLIFNQEHKLSLYTVMIDESYHAYVAYDAILQIQNNTQITPLPLPKITEIEHAIKLTKKKLANKYHDIFNLIAICIAENTINKEMIFLLNQTDTHPFFRQILRDHLADESRHSDIFCNLLRYIWGTITEEYRLNIAVVLPDFIINYLSQTVQLKFEQSVLLSMGFKLKEAQGILDDTYGLFEISSAHPKLNNILRVLEKANVIDEFVKPIFKKEGWL